MRIKAGDEVTISVRVTAVVGEHIYATKNGSTIGFEERQVVQLVTRAIQVGDKVKYVATGNMYTVLAIDSDTAWIKTRYGEYLIAPVSELNCV